METWTYDEASRFVEDSTTKAVADRIAALSGELAEANAEIDRLCAPVCSNCLLSDDIQGVSINTDCGQEYETICAKCQADPKVADYVVHENAYEAFICTRKELAALSAKNARLREALGDALGRFEEIECADQMPGHANYRSKTACVRVASFGAALVRAALAPEAGR